MAARKVANGRGASAAGTPPRAAFTHVSILDVYLWDELIGKATLDPLLGVYVFRYSDAFVQKGVEPAPLLMPTAENKNFVFPELPEATYHRLPAMLSDALPDDFGNALIDRYMSERGISKADVTPLDRLAYMASRGMGALTFRPERGPARHKATAIDIAALVTAARQAVHGLLGSDGETEAALRSIIDVGTSAGGARAKAVIAWNPATQEIRSGQFEAPEGFQHWLLKFDGMGKDRELGAPQAYGRIEYAYHLMAREAGIDMTECRLLDEHGRAHFMTRRFDRADGLVRHHVQTLCAMAHVDFRKKGTNAYSQLFMAIEELGLPYEDRKEAFRRMVFNVMARNCDDHAKNFSFILKRNGSWRLAPGYDITYAYNPTGAWTYQHLMAVNGRFQDISIDDVLADADRFKIGSPRPVIDRVRSAIKEWLSFAARAGVPEKVAVDIGAQHILLEGKG